MEVELIEGWRKQALLIHPDELLMRILSDFRRNSRGYNTHPSRFISMMGRDNVVHEQTKTN